MVYLSKDDIFKILKKGCIEYTCSFPDTEQELRYEYGFIRGVIATIIELGKEDDE